MNAKRTSMLVLPDFPMAIRWLDICPCDIVFKQADVQKVVRAE